MARGSEAAFSSTFQTVAARIEIEGSTDVLRAKEFFLLLSSTGLAFRRCEFAWIDGAQAGIRFISATAKKKATSAAST